MRSTLAALILLGTCAGAQPSDTAADIARALVIGQAYTSGNVYVAGFVEEEPRRWPPRIEGVPLQEGRAERIAADFFRTVVQDSEEHYYFPQREGDAADDDLFTTIDNAALDDRNLARYRAPIGVDRAVTFLGSDSRAPLVNISYKQAGQSRPISEAERKEVAAARKESPKDAECSTEPRYLDSARIVLTADIQKLRASIRLSKYLTPGCAGHLSEIYVLDVMSPNQPAQRFEFRHYHGVL
jgi:hypothetical protein